ncbi:hypothetical protein CWE09_12225 [Aliidiomarina minuta]|uniref:Lipoprotein bor n=1 Tax=Aliidiomarina minuta TaxID=880057 RepID=A0A432W3K5_9GAMM|nr:hypothetical protein [Aliidiomarina minuta]RUO23911.1 hypothetical protein CWE09_12225 [Aliidiomarina minuta]
MKKMITAAAVALTLSACSTIHFDRDDTAVTSPEVSQWHHNFVLALYEASDPVDLNYACRGEDKQWSTVRTEQSFVNGLAGSFTYALWSPKTVAVTCE